MYVKVCTRVLWPLPLMSLRRFDSACVSSVYRYVIAGVVVVVVAFVLFRGMNSDTQNK